MQINILKSPFSATHNMFVLEFYNVLYETDKYQIKAICFSHFQYYEYFFSKAS